MFTKFKPNFAKRTQREWDASSHKTRSAMTGSKGINRIIYSMCSLRIWPAIKWIKCWNVGIWNEDHRGSVDKSRSAASTPANSRWSHHGQCTINECTKLYTFNQCTKRDIQPLSSWRTIQIAEGIHSDQIIKTQKRLKTRRHRHLGEGIGCTRCFLMRAQHQANDKKHKLQFDWIATIQEQQRDTAIKL